MNLYFGFILILIYFLIKIVFNYIILLKNTFKYGNIYYLKKNFNKLKNINIFKYKIENILNENRRSLVYTIRIDNDIFVVKRYNSYSGYFKLLDEFNNLCNLYNEYEIKISPEPICFITNIIYSKNFIISKFIKNEKCNNIYYHISRLIKELHKKNYTYSDIKKEHFLFQNNKMHVIDLDHHLKKRFFFKKLFIELNVIHCIELMPETKGFFNNISTLAKYIYYITMKFKYIESRLNSIRHKILF